VTWVNSFARYYTGNILDNVNFPKTGLLGVERYLENTTSYFCDFESAYSISADREGCGLDYAFYHEVGVAYGPNVIDNNPSNLFSAGMAAADFFYYGCGVYQGAAIPQAVVFEFATAWSPSNSFILEYWDSVGGAWAAVPHYTSNYNFLKTVLTIISEPPSTAGAPIGATWINGYYAYWYRMNFTSVAGGQRSIISGPALISAPGIEIENFTTPQVPPVIPVINFIGGDLAAIARLGYNTQLQLHDIAANHIYARKALMTLYSHSKRDISLTPRTNWFTPYINLTREVGLPTTKPRNQSGIQMAFVRAAGTYTTIYDMTAPATWITQVRITTASTEYVTIAIYDYAALCYQGKYRVFGRMRDVLGGAAKGAVTVSAYLSAPYNIQIGGQAQPVPVLNELIEFGVIDLPAVGEGRASERNITLLFTALTAGNHDINLHDLILWPVDEWTSEVEHEPVLAISAYAPDFIINTFSLLDPVISPKSPRSAIDSGLPITVTIPLSRDELIYPMGQRATMSDSYPKLQANQAQKLFMFQGMQYSILGSNNIVYLYPYYFARAWTIEKQERYESMRGNR